MWCMGGGDRVSIYRVGCVARAVGGNGVWRGGCVSVTHRGTCATFAAMQVGANDFAVVSVVAVLLLHDGGGVVRTK